jgi:hypothetical protein
MMLRTLFCVFCTFVPALLVAAENKLATVKECPDKLTPAIAELIATEGVALEGPKGTICTFWFRKKLDVIPDFKPTLEDKYPFHEGHLIGAVQIPKKTRFKDFRGQRMRSGLYTLRYGKQPQDGNHVGTSELSDFLLAIPAKYDKTPANIKMPTKLHKQSARASRGTHPAIFSLLEAKSAGDAAALTHDEEQEFWIIEVAANGSADGAEVRVPIRFVALGQSEG